MNELKTDDPAKLRAAGVIDLPTLQRYLNLHFSVTIDLFGADESQQRRHLLQHRPEGSLSKKANGSMTISSSGQHLQGACRSAMAGSSSRRRCRCSTRSTRCCATTTSRTRVSGVEPLEPGDRQGRHPFPSCQRAAQGLPPQHRCARRREGLSAMASVDQRGRMGRQRGRMAAQRPPTAPTWQQPDGPSGRAGQVRQLDRTTGARHQPPAGRTSNTCGSTDAH